MFNIGGDDKEKLKENMEEIRNLVNSESEQDESQASPESADMPEQQEMEDMNSENLSSMTHDSSEVEQDQSSQQGDLSPVSESEPSQERSLSQAEGSEPAQRKGLVGQASRNEPGSSSGQKNLSSRKDMKNHLESISNEVKKMEEGERSHGDTLFLEVDEFKEVQTMVEEMKYLSREMKDLMNNLDEGIEEDRRVEGEAENVVEDFSERREKIQSALQ